MIAADPRYLIQNGTGSSCKHPQALAYRWFDIHEEVFKEMFVVGMLYEPGVQFGGGTPVGRGAASSQTVVVAVGLSLLA